jgi:hypothetical protein
LLSTWRSKARVSPEPDGARTGAVHSYKLKKNNPSVGTTR